MNDEKYLSYVKTLLHDVHFPVRSGDVEIRRIDHPDHYVHVLFVDDAPIVSTSEADLMYHKCLATNCAGNVLLTGYGLGIAALLAQHNVFVDTITIIEKNVDVARVLSQLVTPKLTKLKNLYIADANTAIPHELFDYSFIDHDNTYDKDLIDQYRECSVALTTGVAEVHQWWDRVRWERGN